jgi:hypothetical protein
LRVQVDLTVTDTKTASTRVPTNSGYWRVHDLPKGSNWARTITTKWWIVRALLIDDSEDVRMTTAWALSWEGFETAVVRLGREVPGMINSFQPDVLILDLTQPEVNGPMIARLLRENWPNLPIILAQPRNGYDFTLPPKAEAVPRPYSIETMVEAIVRLTYSPSKDL